MRSLITVQTQLDSVSTKAKSSYGTQSDLKKKHTEVNVINSFIMLKIGYMLKYHQKITCKLEALVQLFTAFFVCNEW